MKKITITLCMGSACFARGNAENLEFLETYIKDNNPDIDIELVGDRCSNKCASGPNVIIDGKAYDNVDIFKLKKILEGIDVK